MASWNDQRSEIYLPWPSFSLRPFHQHPGLDKSLQQNMDEERLIPLMIEYSSTPTPTLTTSPQDPQLHCEVCDRIFETKAKYNRHRKTHTRPYKCQEIGCRTAFASRKDLERHNHSKHVLTSRAEKFPCPVLNCSFHRHESRGGFGRKDNLLRHMRRAHGAENGPGGQLSQVTHLMNGNWDEEMIDIGEQDQPGRSQGDDGIKLDNKAQRNMEWETTASSSEAIPSAQGIYLDPGIEGSYRTSTVQPSDPSLVVKSPQSYNRGSPLVVHRDRYTVGWLCALSLEMAACSAMLDEVHCSPPQSLDDGNDYTFGRIGSHNIVIASLSASHNYTSSVAQVASQMRSTFPALRFGLLVGIGSGVPITATEIRLGDVVVGQPDKQFGGVVQYDIGKRGSDGSFLPTGSLDAPPQVLLTALQKLRSKHQKSINKSTDYLDHLCSTNPEFQYPGRETHLRSGIGHAHTSGKSGEGYKIKGPEDRNTQTREHVVVHYGTIASGNQLIRDSVTGQQLAENIDGVLCFEMEAAGLMNTFPCLVIRGICDYIDSHKSHAWQAYAAATAAAYAKDLLNVILARDVAKTRTVWDIIPAETGKHSNSLFVPSL
jgi:nucleoside phosphorylase